MPQLPQLAGSVAVVTQLFPHALWPDGHTQVPPTQDWPETQPLLQPPQFAESVSAFTHAVPHWRRPCAQETEQVPLEQTSFAAQLFPQPPQFWALVCRFTQAPPHSASPGPAHEGTHAPPAQESSLPHTVPHAPQLNLSVRRSTHALPHCASPSLQSRTQMPAWQSSAAAQGDPQRPQWATSEARFTQSPPPHVVSGAAHSHTPPSHVRNPPHAFSQVPQFCVSRLTSAQPPLQLSVPFGQSERHWPWKQTSAPAHMRPQAPQLSGDRPRSTQVLKHSSSPAPHRGTVDDGTQRPASHDMPPGQSGSFASPQ